MDRLFYGFWTVPFLGSLHFNVIQGKRGCYDEIDFACNTRNTSQRVLYWKDLDLCTELIQSIGIFQPEFQQSLVLCFRLFFTTIAHYGMDSHLFLNEIHGSSFICYTILHSLSAHKEFRFLLPILPLVLRTSRSCHLQQDDDDSADLNGS